MIIKQVSIFIENKPGRLAEITGVIADNNINLRTLSLVESDNSGILRIIVDAPDRVKEILKAKGITASVKEVLCVLVDDRAGGLADMLRVIADNNIAVKYMYAFVVEHEKACIIMRVEDEETVKATEILKKAGYEGLNTK